MSDEAMEPEDVLVTIIQFESRSGTSEGRMTFDSGAFFHIGPRPEDLEIEEGAPLSTGVVRYRLVENHWNVEFVDPE